MKKKRIYRTIRIQDVELATLLALITTKVIVAIDIAKEAMVAGFADALGRVEMLVRFSHPAETRLFFELLVSVRAAGRDVDVAMEPTGVYGEPLRHQLTARNFEVHRVDPKRAHDAAMVLDGVPSQHDPKACTLIAFLHAQGISARWKERSELEQHARALIDEHSLLEQPLERVHGWLEALTVTHWPELNVMISRGTVWYLHLLSEFPTPQHVAESEDAARELLRCKTYGKLAPSKIHAIIHSASTSLGVPATCQQAELIRITAREALLGRTRLMEIEDRMRALTSGQPALARVASAVGPAAAVAIFATLGDPAQYASAAAFVKACGLNLRERSSGKDDGRLHITKRGPGCVRRYLFLTALRMIVASPVVRAWFERRESHRDGIKSKAVVAIMRKLARALVPIARGSGFDATKLFDVRRLPLPNSPSTAVT